ncbi:hypothetical protein [Vibrio casei]|uniref:hypothetical protein n=1 Tax=Vibrio casei TaxID=673372 RepID=UPI003F9C1489
MITDQFWAIDGYYNAQLVTYSEKDKPMIDGVEMSLLALESSYDVFVWWSDET